MKNIILFLCLVALNCSAYTKIGVGYILDQPQYITYNNRTIRQQLDYATWSAHVETGLQVGQWSTGIHYAKGNGDVHDPSKLEAFLDYDWVDDMNWQLITGIGYKLMHQDYIEYNGKKDRYNHGTDDKYSARIGLSRSVGQYEFGLWHHSQWFTGVPINETWEYYKTELTVSWRF